MTKTSLRYVLLLAVGLALLAGAAQAADQEKPTTYTLTLSTESQAMPFKMPAIPNMPNLPNMPDFAAMFKPKRVISGNATYPNQAVEPIFVTVPGDLNLPDNKLVLQVPKPVPAPPGGEEGGVAPPPTKFDMTVLVYWHPETAQGPLDKSIHVDTSTLPRGGRMNPGAMGAMGGFDPGKWAFGSQGKLPPNVVGKGDYVLNTGSLDAPLDGFLPAIEVSKPEGLNDVDPNAGFTVEWKPVAGARGFIIHAMGTVMAGGKMTKMIHWVSTLNQPPERVWYDYQQATTIADDLANGILLPPDTTSCQVPPGIFPGVTMFTLTVTAIGNDYFSAEGGVTVVGKIRAKWTAMKMPNMGGMGGFGGPGGGAPPPPPGGDQ